MFTHRKGGRLTAAMLVTGALVASAPAAAQATPLAGVAGGIVGGVTSTLRLPNGTTCEEPYSDTTPFTPWQDENDYRLVPGGSFSTGATDWTLAGPAAVIPSTDPYELSGAPGNGELILGPGAVAISPYSCVDATQPTIRFMEAGTRGAVLTVSAIYQESPTATLTLPLGVIMPDSGWQPSPILQNDESVAGLLSGGEVPMALELRASSGTAVVDDAFVDPRMRY